MPDKKKLLKYNKEQQEILDKLKNILNYNNDYTFYLYDLDNKIELQESIIGLSDDIRKYYPASSCIGVNGQNCKRPYLSIIRYILKFHNKELYAMDFTMNIENGETTRTKKYKII